MQPDTPSNVVVVEPGPTPELNSLPEELRALVLQVARQLTRATEIRDIWQPLDIASYWVLLIGGTNRHEHLKMAQEILTWGAFSARGSARVVCIQHGDAKEFNACAKHFEAKEFPALFLGTSPEMISHVGLPKAVLQGLAVKDGGLHDFLTETHAALVRGDSLADIKNRLLKDKAFQLGGAFYRELRSIISLKAGVEVKP